VQADAGLVSCTKMKVISMPDCRLRVRSVTPAPDALHTTCCTLPLLMSSVKAPVAETGIKLMPNLTTLGNVGTEEEVVKATNPNPPAAAGPSEYCATEISGLRGITLPLEQISRRHTVRIEGQFVCRRSAERTVAPAEKHHHATVTIYAPVCCHDIQAPIAIEVGDGG
jgi:hypothetical protein